MSDSRVESLTAGTEDAFQRLCKREQLVNELSAEKETVRQLVTEASKKFASALLSPSRLPAARVAQTMLGRLLRPKKNCRVSGYRPSLNKTSVPKNFIGPKNSIILIIVKITVYDAFFICCGKIVAQIVWHISCR
jgi:hypothetical protein